MIADLMDKFTEETGIKVDYDMYGNVMTLHPSTDGNWAMNRNRIVQYLNANNIRYTVG